MTRFGVARFLFYFAAGINAPHIDLRLVGFNMSGTTLPPLTCSLSFRDLISHVLLGLSLTAPTSLFSRVFTSYSLFPLLCMVALIRFLSLRSLTLFTPLFLPIPHNHR